MLMEDVTLGTTKEVQGGFNMQCVLSAVDALAEYHCFQLTCRKQTVDKYLDSGLMVLAKDHFLYKHMKRAVDYFLEILKSPVGSKDQHMLCMIEWLS